MSSRLKQPTLERQAARNSAHPTTPTRPKREIRSEKGGTRPTGAEGPTDDGMRLVSNTARQGAHVVEMQRRRLLLAIIQIVADDGLEGASVGRVCKRAGVSRRTFYEIFEDLETCLLAAFDEAIERLAMSVLPAYKREQRWSLRIRAGLTALLGQLDCEPNLAHLCVVAAPRASHEIVERRKRVLDAVTVAVNEGCGDSRQADMLPPLTAQGVVGGAISVIHAHLLEDDHGPLAELVSPLMGMIVHPYLGPAAARREMERPGPKRRDASADVPKDPFNGLSIRFTYRTARVLATIATAPGASNRLIADTAGIVDEGQISRLLRRLQDAGLAENRRRAQAKGEPNAWELTDRGQAVHTALGTR